MAGYFGSIKPYFLIGIIVYIIYRVLLRLLYRNGRMRVPVAHEVGMALLAWWLLTLFSASVSPALGFSLKPAFPGTNLIPVYGTVRMVRESGVGALFGAFLKYIPIGFLVPFLFRRSRNPGKVLSLCGSAALFIEVFQLFMPSMVVRLDDILWALFGGFVGYFLFGLLCMNITGIERMATVKRSRGRQVPAPVRLELELVFLLMLLPVMVQGTRLEIARVQEVRAQEEQQAKAAAEAKKAAEEAEAKRLAEAEAKKLKEADSMPELSLEAGAAVLFSVDDDLILYEKAGADQEIPASTTKLMTALTVLNYCDPTEKLTAGEEITRISGQASNASLKEGITGTVETFLGAMLIPSGNDAAYALATYTGRKILGNDSASVDEALQAFLDAEKDLGTELNLENSNFLTPDGDQTDGQYSCARDMVRIARECLKNDTIKKLCGAKSYRGLFDNLDLTYKNTNELIQPSGEYYYEGAIGMKTGSFNDVKCLVAAAEIGGKTYIAVLMQDGDPGRYKDAKILFDYVAGDSGDTGEDTPAEE